MVIDDVITDLVDQGICSNRQEASALLYNGGLAIYSTVDTNLQSIMEDVMSKEPGNYYPDRPIQYTDPTTGETKTQNVQGAMITIDYTGAIKAVVGGVGEKEADRSLNHGGGRTGTVADINHPGNIRRHEFQFVRGYRNFNSFRPGRIRTIGRKHDLADPQLLQLGNSLPGHLLGGVHKKNGRVLGKLPHLPHRLLGVCNLNHHGLAAGRHIFSRLLSLLECIRGKHI